jgi:hypothetical protein
MSRTSERLNLGWFPGGCASFARFWPVSFCAGQVDRAPPALESSSAPPKALVRCCEQEGSLCPPTADRRWVLSLFLQKNAFVLRAEIGLSCVLFKLWFCDCAFVYRAVALSNPGQGVIGGDWRVVPQEHGLEAFTAEGVEDSEIRRGRCATRGEETSEDQRRKRWSTIRSAQNPLTKPSSPEICSV